MNLVVDIGNTCAKAAIFEDGALVASCLFRAAPAPPWGLPYDFVRAMSGGARTMYVSSSGMELEGALKFDHTTPVPIRNLYATPGTLGPDRLAAAVGANAIFPGETVLVCDFGTAITFDVVTDGAFGGGNISPGAGMRFRALHEFTGKLPLIELSNFVEVRQPDAWGGGAFEFPSDNTTDAIVGGVVCGIVAEVECYIKAMRVKYGDVKVIFTGGDGEYFAERVNFTIFVRSELVLHGLNAILDYNA